MKRHNTPKHDTPKHALLAQERARRLSMLTLEILQHKGQVGQGLYEIGIRLVQVSEDNLWRDGGRESFEDYLAHDVNFSRSTAYRLMRIARSFDGRVVARHGVEKLDLAVRYLRAAKPPKQSDPMRTRVMVRDRGGSLLPCTLAEATTDQIHVALAELRGLRTHNDVVESLKTRIQQLESRLPPAPDGTHRGSRIRLRKSRDGRVAATFHAIPIDQLETFAQLLGELLTDLSLSDPKRDT